MGKSSSSISQKELTELPDNNPNIFKKSSATFCNGKYSILDDFCYADFLAY